MYDSSLRIGVVQYANAIPLEYDLPRFFPKADIMRGVPSLLARQLQTGELDIAMVSSIELLRHPEYDFIPGLGVCSDGPVKSVCLFCKEELPHIKTVALDRSSLTSVTMIRILFAEYWKTSPTYVSFDPPVENGLKIADAALSIGDPTLHFQGDGLITMDVGELWKQYCGLPFIYALWVTRGGIDPAALAKPFTDAAESALSKISEMSDYCSGKSSLTTDFYHDYFTRCIHYRTSQRDMDGLHFFFKRAKEYLQ